MRHLTIALAIVSSLFITLNSQAQTKSQTKVTQTKSPSNPEGLWFMAGGNGSSINTDLKNGLTEGTQAGIRALGSYYSSNMIYNAGINVEQLRIENADSFNAGAIDLAARYRFTEKWNAGVDLSTYVNSGEKFGGDSSSLTPFLGLGVARDFAAGSNLVRLGGRVLADTDIRSSTVSMGQILLEIGFGGSDARSASAVTAAAAAAVATAKTETSEKKEVAAPAEVTKTQTAEKIDALVLNFDTSSAALEKKNIERVSKLADILEKNKNLFGKVEIIGYADKTGTDKFNSVLSKNRALTVAEVMKKSAPEVSKSIVGMGTANPISDDLAPNRRVEVIIRDVKDETALKKLIESLN